MTVDDDRLADVATRAARAGGEYLADVFRSGPVTAEYGTDDVVADVDRDAEARVLAVIRDAFPEHAIYAEESGQTSGTTDRNQSIPPYQWFVDPLDGTNNFASGLAAFATAVAVRHDGRTRGAAIHEPVPDDLYLARHGRGATVNGEPIRASSDVDLEHGTVAFVVGLPALRDPALRAEADRMETALQDTCKRVLQTWAPCVDWGLLARGGIEGLVAFHPASYERHAGELLTVESGASVRTVSNANGGANVDGGAHVDDGTHVDDGALSVSACDDSTLEELVAVLGYE